MSTQIKIGGQTIVSSSHIIQAGSDLQWMESETLGKRLQMIRNGMRMQIFDLSSGQTQVSPALKSSEPLSPVQVAFAKGHWLAPIQISSGLWEMMDTTRNEAYFSQKMRFSETWNQIIQLQTVNLAHDTALTDLGWGTVGGRLVPTSINVSVRSQGVVNDVYSEYSNWFFPRSIPNSLFRIK